MSLVKKRGFTLIEILVVVAVISVLSAIVLVAINPIKTLSRTRDNNRKLNLRSIQGVLEMYYGQNRFYPTYAASYTSGSLTFGAQLDYGGVVYQKVIPQDPTPGWGYCYNRPTASTYVMCAAVEDTGSISVPSGVTSCNPTGTGKVGDYCLTNPF